MIYGLNLKGDLIIMEFLLQIKFHEFLQNTKSTIYGTIYPKWSNYGQTNVATLTPVLKHTNNSNIYFKDFGQ